MQLIVVRHGKTLENEQGISQGQSEGTLSEQGIKDNKKLAKELSHMAFDAVYTSPLKRTVSTCEHILEQNSTQEYQKDDRLMERHMGELQEKPFPIDFDINRLYEGMETVDDMVDRVQAFLTEIKAKHASQKVLVVSHGLTIQILCAVINHDDIVTLTHDNIIKNSSYKLFHLN